MASETAERYAALMSAPTRATGSLDGEGETPLLTSAVIRALATALLALAAAGAVSSARRAWTQRIAPIEQRIDPNLADAPTLRLLRGIGPALASRIIEERERSGPFRSADELRRVRGLGPRTIRRLRPTLRFSARFAGESADSLTRP